MLIAGAATQISFKAMPDFFIAGIGITLQNLRCRHNHAGRSVAALQSVVLPKTFLDLNRGDLRSIGLDGE